MKKYVCPKCKSTVHSDKNPEYCVCGGKYEQEWDINKAYEMFADMFGGKK